jgi:hypothetical protein
MDLTFQISVPLVDHQDLQTEVGQTFVHQNGAVVYNPVQMAEPLDLAITEDHLVAHDLDMMWDTVIAIIHLPIQLQHH